MLRSSGMLSKVKLFDVYNSFGQPRMLYIPNWVFNKSFCNMDDSSELHSWVKFPSKGGYSVAEEVDEASELPSWFKFPPEQSCSVADEVEDFVLPSTVTVASNKLQDASAGVQNVSSSVFEGDIDEISMILKDRCTSPDAVVEALAGYNFDISNSLVDKVLTRFCNNWIPAFGFFKWASVQRSYKHSADSYDLMVDILGSAEQFGIVRKLLEEMVQLGGLVSLTTMSKILRRIVRAGRPVGAIIIFRELEIFGLTKNTAVMNVLLDALCKERSVEYAWDAYAEFKSKIPVDAQTFNILIHGCCKARQLDQAWWTMEEMRRYGFQPCVISYTILIEAYCREKDFRKVDVILDEMQSKGCPPNVVTYTIVMHSLGKAKETHEAFGIYQRMKENGCVPDTSFYNSFIYILSQADRFQDVRNIFQEMCDSGTTPDVTTYNTMISAACAHSQVESALKLLQEMEERHCKPNLKTYAPLLKICCRRKWMKLLYHLLNDMFRKDVSIELGTYTLLVNGLCKSGKLEQACSFFEEMVLKGLFPRFCTYEKLVEELERKNMDKAKESIQQLMVQARNVQQPG